MLAQCEWQEQRVEPMLPFFLSFKERFSVVANVSRFERAFPGTMCTVQSEYIFY
jgi:hypothetical protein